MRRREVLASVAAVGAAGLSGCTTLWEFGRSSPSPTATRRPVSLPYGDGLETPRDLVVTNRGDRPQYVTVSVWAGERNLFVDSRDVDAGATVRHPNLIGGPGDYRVVVERSTGPRAVYHWAVGAGRQDLHVRVADAVSFVQDLRCAPGCAAIESTGEAAGWPYTAGADRSMSYPATVYLENRAADARTATLRLGHEGESVLDYRYVVASDERVVLPGIRASGEYRVDLAAGEHTARFDWPVRAGAELSGYVGPESVALDCGPANTSLTLVNSREESHALTVSIRDDRRVRYAAQISLFAGERRTIGPVDEPGRYRLHVNTEYGIATTEPWVVCSPLAGTTVRIRPDGELEISRTYPA